MVGSAHHSVYAFGMAAVLEISVPGEIPPLEAGDFLSREEFERRYWAMPGVKKAELIEGIVYMPSPVRVKHGEPHNFLGGWSFNYAMQTPGVQAVDDSTVRLDSWNEPQPDVILRIRPEWGGLSQDEDEYITGSPELAMEVAASTASYDLHQKKRAYLAAGIPEYLVWIVAEKRIQWWKLENGEYVSLPANSQGIVKSEVFPGLWLDTEAARNLEPLGLVSTLQEGIASPEHAEFVRLLASRNSA